MPEAAGEPYGDDIGITVLDQRFDGQTIDDAAVGIALTADERLVFERGEIRAGKQHIAYLLLGKRPDVYLHRFFVGKRISHGVKRHVGAFDLGGIDMLLHKIAERRNVKPAGSYDVDHLAQKRTEFLGLDISGIDTLHLIVVNVYDLRITDVVPQLFTFVDIAHGHQRAVKSADRRTADGVVFKAFLSQRTPYAHFISALCASAAERKRVGL